MGQVLLPTGLCAENLLDHNYKDKMQTLILLLHLIGLQLALHFGCVIGKYNIML